MATQEDDHLMERRSRSEGHRDSTSTKSGSIKLSGYPEETCFTSQAQAILTESNLARVLNVLSKAGDKWINIGIQLGIPTLKLNDIDSKKHSASSDALRDILIYCCSQGKTRLKDLIEALRSPTVDQQVCANDLEAVIEELSLNNNQLSPNLSDSSDGTSGDKQGQYPIVRRLTKGEAKGAKCSHHFDVIVVGDSNVGKSLMLSNYGFKTGNDTIRPTVTPEPLGHRVFKYRDKFVKLKVWDMPGHCSCFNVVNKSILESADGAILLFDVTNKQSFINLLSDEHNSRKIEKSWMKELKFKAKNDKHPVMILVGNKIDCTERKVSNSEVEQVSASEGTGMPYFEISAKETVGIEEVFTEMIVLLMRKAAKDKRYGADLQKGEGGNSNHDHHSHEYTVSGGHGRNMTANSYPGTATQRNQPTSHSSTERSDSNSTPQPPKSNGCICCCCVLTARYKYLEDK